MNKHKSQLGILHTFREGEDELALILCLKNKANRMRETTGPTTADSKNHGLKFP